MLPNSRLSSQLLGRLALGITAVAVTMAAFLSYQVLRQEMLSRLKNEALSQVTLHIEKVDAWLGAIKGVVETIAHSETVQTVNWQTAYPYLQSEDDRLKDFMLLGLAQSDGWRYTTADKKRVYVGDRAWFKTSFMGQVYVNDPVIARSNGRPSVVVAAPIRSRQTSKSLGVAFGGIMVDHLAATINNIHYGNRSYAFLLNSKGSPIIHPNPSLRSTAEKPVPSLLTASDPNLAAIAQQMVAGQTKIIATRLEGQQVYVVFAPLKEAKWSIALVMPRENIESQLQLLDWVSIPLFVLVASLLGILTYIHSQEQLRLQQSQADIAAANQILEARVAERTQELQITLDQLQQSQADTAAANQILEARVAERTQELQVTLDQLAASKAEIEQSNQSLEQRVQERTHELQATLQQLSQSQVQLVQSEKMSALGNLVAGLAHEINNPVTFISGNLHHLEKASCDLLELVDLYQVEFETASEKITDKIDEIDWEFFREDLQKVFGSMREGTQRIGQIILSLRNFSRVDEVGMKVADLHQGLDSTLVILQNRLVGTGTLDQIHVEKHYAPLPEVECYPGQLNQVFMNLLSNAVDALVERAKKVPAETLRSHPNQIMIHTELVSADELMAESIAQSSPETTTSDWVRVRVSDNGLGMTEVVRSRVFDPFFTTKPVGQGTGLGLSISYQIITEKHGGRLTCHSVPHQGTEFVLEIPLLSQRIEPNSTSVA